ncbi:hypothetical protein PPSQR21_038480 [Paenibacillus polymyxa SQR-21]|uniref:hypothetical protein n=1 Tax=Paenibacillus polymyxa TaxID=1406 RepID=UPI00042F3E04|nr:hypothetical protein [Paenibacillus polymyxa]AHM67486.1 hypothetical protein PPSQR21_038480 [Paenibacillus polymyxa SQR-21]
MNKLQKIKLSAQLREIKKSTLQCEAFLKVYAENLPEDQAAVVGEDFQRVIQHQKNMNQLFGVLEQQLQK